MAASHNSAKVRLASPTRAFVVGELTTRSCTPKGILRSSLSWPASTRLRIAAAAKSLNVLHIGNSSFERYPLPAPVLVSKTATPSRPPLVFSMFANSASRAPDTSPAQAKRDKPGIAPVDTAERQKIRLVSIIVPFALFVARRLHRQPRAWVSTSHGLQPRRFTSPRSA